MHKIDQYLSRIDYQGTTDASFETLRGIHEAHVFGIPFENITVLRHEPVSLDVDDLLRKFVEEHRGGYCFEMNGLFSYVLKELGFKVHDLLARGYSPESGYRAKAHQALLVEADGERWFCDVGFGGNGLLSPLRFELGLAQKQYWSEYRIIEDPVINGYAYQYKIDGEFRTTYVFTLEECFPVDFELSNHFTSTHETSGFRKRYMVNLPNHRGRVSINDHTLKILTDGELVTKELNTATEMKDALEQYFELSVGDNVPF